MSRCTALLLALLALSGGRAAPVLAAGAVSVALEEVKPLIEAGEFGAAAERAARALAEEPAAADSLALELRGLWMLAEVRRGDLAAAERIQRGTVERREGGPPLAHADALGDLAMICDFRGDDAGAAAAWRTSVKRLRELPAAEVATRIVPRLDGLAEKERRRGEYAEAERLLREAIDRSAADLPRDAAHARLLNNLGALYWDQHRYDEASRLLREALRVSEAQPEPDPARLAVALHNLGNLHREQGRLDEAERLHERAVALAREHLADDERLAIFLKEPAVVAREREEWATAEARFAEALAVAERRDQSRVEAEIRYERGRMAAARGDLDAARADFAASRALREGLGPDHPDLAQADVALALLAGADGRAALERASAILAANAVHPRERLAAERRLAQLDWEAGARAAAIARHRSTFAAAGELRAQRSASERSRAEWAASVADLAHEAVAWLVAEGRGAEALAWSDDVRGRVLRDQMEAAGVTWESGVPAAARERLETQRHATRAAVTTARRALDDAAPGERGAKAEALRAAVARWRDVEEEMRAASTVYHATVAAAGEDVVAVAAARLAPEELALVWQVGRESSHLFVLAPDGSCDAFRLRLPPAVARAWGEASAEVTEAQLERVLREGVASLGTSGASGLLAPEGHAGGGARRGIGRLQASDARRSGGRRLEELARLADVLVPPEVRRRLAAAPRVYVAPDGPLHRLPFEALVWEQPGGEPVYWLDRGPVVVYTHSLATLVRLHGRPASAAPAVLSVADPARGAAADRAALAPLPGARRESAAFARAFRGLDVVTLVNEEAREAAVRAQLGRARVIHLGTHGRVEQDADDLLAALVLAPEPGGSPDDGYLHLFEVYELELGADLVVLSACETRLGRRVRGEGVFALSRGFLAAGAKRTVASLWPVDDDATASVMTAYFGRLGVAAGERIDYATALRDAKRDVRNEPATADPFFWAAFVLTGVY